MFRAIVLTQWKGSRLVVMLAAAVAFVIPLGSLRSASAASTPYLFIQAMQGWAGAYALLAAGVGLLVAMAAWQPDHAGRHVYALALPVSRARYTLLRLGAGALFLLPVVLALAVSAVIVAVSGAIPAGLHAYPVSLVLRFAFAAALAYAVFFAIASATPQTAGVILGSIAAVLFTQYILTTFDTGQNILEPIVTFIFMRPGLLSIFAGRWMLVDV